jgi:predicted  nucleic acid-binding Zn-ribbon protein
VKKETKPVEKKQATKAVAPKPAEKQAVKKTVPAKTTEKKVEAAKAQVTKAAPVKIAAKPEVTKAPPVKIAAKPEAKKAPAVKGGAKPASKEDKTIKEVVPAVAHKNIAYADQEVPKDPSEVSIEKKLIALYSLQQIDSQVDKIRIIRGELPLEVQDLEDEIAGLETRIENYLQENSVLEKSITEKKFSIKDSQTLIKKYEEQQMNVRNNREYDSLTKEIEIQSLEIQLSEKRIREFQQALEAKTEEINRFQSILSDRKNDLDIKKNELDDIVAETEKEENELIHNSEINRKFIEDRLITAYSRIRKNARNGLAVVQIERDACGGCFNKIPPQHQLDIRMHKKIIVCEYCGRILVDDGIVNLV